MWPSLPSYYLCGLITFKFFHRFKSSKDLPNGSINLFDYLFYWVHPTLEFVFVITSHLLDRDAKEAPSTVKVPLAT